MIDYDLQQVMRRLRREEGFKAHMYDDFNGKRYRPTAEGVVSIGYGLNLEDGISEKVGEAIMREQAIERGEELEARMARESYGDLRDHPEKVRHALYDLAYNMGCPRLFGFKRMFAALAMRDYRRMAEELLDSRYARRLPHRAERNASMVRESA